jgi:hypothetical protein
MRQTETEKTEFVMTIEQNEVGDRSRVSWWRQKAVGPATF